MQHTETIKVNHDELIRLQSLSESNNRSGIEIEYITNIDNDKDPVIALYKPDGYGNENLMGFLSCTVVKNNRAGNNLFGMYEAIIDITLMCSYRKFKTPNSRMLIEYIVDWAEEFEKANKGVEWGIDTELDYMEAIDEFAFKKIDEAVKNGFGYIDND